MSFWSEIFGGMSGQEIYENFANAQGPRGLEQGSLHLSKVEVYYTRREEQITAIAGSMEEGWTGDAGGAARRGAGPLAIAHGGAAQELATAKDALITQSDDFYRVKSSVDPVPEPPDKPSTFKNVITLGGAQSNYENKVRESNEVAQKNVAAMDDWTTASGYNGRVMPTEFGDLDPNAFKITIDDGKVPPPIEWRPIKPPPPGGKEPDDGNDKGTIKPGTGKDGTGEDGTGRKPGEIKVPPPPDDGRRPGRDDEQTTPEKTKTPPKLPPGIPPDDGRIPGRIPGKDDEDGGIWGPTGSGRGGDTGTGTGRGIGTGSGSGSGSGSAGGRLTGGGASGAGSSTGASDRLGAGRGSGVGGMGPGEPGARGGAGARGAGGRGAGPGMGGMGQGGRGGGDEDEEHQRKYVLEDDAAFQLTDEDGEKYVDPRTGMSPVTPVIGE
ncbi:hypothetical protein [Amycolatopsis sp. NPDC059657]|uniref:hypothetical protein n=1 Tax=Amycolatopsis sp. NPDC059657 TaxID=3346899 RepID=UPI00366E9BB2